jgi:oxygen-independent coproporphyrinogen-3 oxidase
MLRLRTSDGLDMCSFSGAYGAEAASTVMQAVQKHMDSGLVLKLPRLQDRGNSSGSCATTCTDIGMIADSQPTALPPSWDFRIRLSDPEGFLLSNSIISDVFAAFSFDTQT